MSESTTQYDQKEITETKVCVDFSEKKKRLQHLGICDKINKEKVTAIEIKSGEYQNSKKVLTRFREVEKMLQTEEMNNSTN